MEKEMEMEYEAPTMVEVGDFAEITMGCANWGFDSTWTCPPLSCH